MIRDMPWYVFGIFMFGAFALGFIVRSLVDIERQAGGDIREIVFEALNNAVENGHQMQVLPVEEIIADLQRYDCDCEDLTADELRLHVQAWLAR